MEEKVKKHKKENEPTGADTSNEYAIKKISAKRIRDGKVFIIDLKKWWYRNVF